MKAYKLVERYVRNERTDKSENTNAQSLEQISRILSQLEKFGVKVKDDSIEGLNGLVLSDWKGMIASTHKPATTNVYICVMRPFLRWLYNVGLTERDFSQAIKTLRLPSIDEIPEEERPADKYLTHEQAQELLNTASGYNRERDRAIIALILYTGLRTQELCSLNIGNFVGEKAVHGEITVKRKGGKYKKVPVPDAYYPYLEAYLRTRKNAKEDEPLFLTTKGQRCSRTQIWKALSKKQKSVGNIATGGHALRHTFVSEAMRVGGAAAARDLANHRTLAITNRYSHTTEEQRRSVVNAIAW